MLAMLERVVTDAEGSYAFCHTDSMAIVSTAKDGEDEPADDTEGGDDPLADRPGHRLGRYLDRTSKKHDKTQPQQKKRSKKQKQRRKKQKERGV